MSSCADKRWFPSSKATKRHIRKIKGKIGNPLKAYKCPDCDGYHMTSKVAMAYQIVARASKCEDMDT